MHNYFRSIPLSIRISSMVVLLVFVGLTGAMNLSFQVASDLMTGHAVMDIEYNGEKQAELFSIYLKEFKNDVRLLVNSPGIHGIVSGLNSGDDTKVKLWTKRLQQRFVAMGGEQYLQVRFIIFADNDREIVRADRSGQSSILEVTPDPLLQEKGHTLYVQATKTLQPGEFYISAIDLNKENGVLSEPHQPTFRVAMPVFIQGQDSTTAHAPFGMVVVNVDANYLFHVLSDITIAEVILVNRQGYFLYYPDYPQKCWGWELGQSSETLNSAHPEFKGQHHKKESGLVRGDDGDIFYFQRIFLDAMSGEYVTLLLYAQEQTIVSSVRALQRKMGPIALLTLLMTGLSVYFIVQLITGSIRRLTKKVDLLSSGAQDISFSTTRNDEIGRLSSAFANLLTQLTNSREEALDQKRAFQSLYEKSSDAILLIEEGKFTDCNEATIKILNYGSKKEVLDLEPSQLSPEYQPDGLLSSEKYDKLIEKTIRDGASHFEWLHIRANGEPFWVDAVLTALSFGDRNVLHVAWRDIDQRKQVETDLTLAHGQLEQQKKNFEVLYEQSRDAIILMENGLVVDCNDATVRLMNAQSKDEFLNTPSADLSPKYQPDGRLSMEKSAEMMQVAMEQGSNHFEWLYKRASDEEFWVDIVLSKITVGAKDMLHGAVRDITMQKQLAVDIRRERDMARQANQAKSEFLANMSHELRTPMHGILSYANMGTKRWQKASRDKLQRYFQTIVQSGSSLMGLLNNLLDISKLDAGKMVYSMQEDDIHGWIQLVEKEYESMAEEKNIRLLCMGLNQPVMACFDGDKVAQVLRNIISNAIKFTSFGHDIRIWCNGVIVDGISYSQVNVSDGGIGIPEAERATIFDTFIQSSETITGAGGTGLGLAICRRIIEDHHGHIWAENNGDGGACFSFTLPVEKEGKV